MGTFFSMFMVIGLWYSNAFNSGFLPMNSNDVFDNKGHHYNVSRAISGDGLINQTKYEQYSPAFLSAGNITLYIFSFCVYTATLIYAGLYHGHEIKMAFVEFFQGLRRKKGEDATENKHEDVHNRLMKVYL